MFQQLHIQIQVGGSDQYGNICAGIEAVDTMRKAKNADVNLKDPLRGPYGLTTPLLTTASGEKFGKSAGNAVWLDPEMLSSYDLYKVHFPTMFPSGSC
jgi:tyrosyl-tRNA synthetase